MSTRKTSLKTLGKKGVPANKAGAVKGGVAKPKETTLNGVVIRNHNLVVR